MSDLRGILGDKYDATIEEASRAYIVSYENGTDLWPEWVEFADSDRPDGDEGEFYTRVIVAETRRDMAATLAAVLPDLLADAWALGWMAGVVDHAEDKCHGGLGTPNPYRQEQ